MRPDSCRRARAIVALVGLLALGIGSSAAYFTDGLTIAQHFIADIPEPPPTLPLSATVRVEPQKINLKEKGDGELKAFIDKLPAPHALSEIDLSSITLCYAGACIPSDGAAKLDGKAHVAAEFDRAALAGLVGTARGDLTLVVQGKLIAGGTFSGKDTNRVTGGSDATSGTTVGVVPNALPAATPTPTPTPDVIATPTP